MQIREERSVQAALFGELKRLILAGVYRHGERLPSVRTIALEKGINPNTAQRAYLRLEEEGFVKIYEKKGAFVVYEKEKTDEGWKKVLQDLKAAGVSKEQMERAISEVYGGEDDA